MVRDGTGYNCIQYIFVIRLGLFGSISKGRNACCERWYQKGSCLIEVSCQVRVTYTGFVKSLESTALDHHHQEEQLQAHQSGRYALQLRDAGHIGLMLLRMAKSFYDNESNLT